MREQLQVVHHLRVLGEGVGNAGGMIHGWQAVAPRLSVLDATLDVANRVQVLRELRPIARTQLTRQRVHARDDRVEDAAVLLHARRAGAAVGRPAVTE